jgi:ATPase subunit of ABC transporter with duplicated ATPase domains
MGRNGAGKTTLLKSLLANYPGLADKDFTLDSGTVFWGHEAQIGYFPQDVGATLSSSKNDNGLTVCEWLHRWNPAAHVEDIRGILGQMLFSGEEGDKQTKALSGGEQARLAFCKLILTKPNILIFDEPTNHLDLEAINALNIALQRYEGTVLLVTHDHDLIDEVATRLWVFHESSIEDFQGPYAEWKGKHN